MLGFSSKALLMARGATTEACAETRLMKEPICGMPVAVFEGPTTGTPRRWAMGLAEKACWERVGPTRASTPRLICRVKAALAAGSSLPPSSMLRVTGLPLIPPPPLMALRAKLRPVRWSWP